MNKIFNKTNSQPAGNLTWTHLGRFSGPLWVKEKRREGWGALQGLLMAFWRTCLPCHLGWWISQGQGVRVCEVKQTNEKKENMKFVLCTWKNFVTATNNSCQSSPLIENKPKKKKNPHLHLVWPRVLFFHFLYRHWFSVFLIKMMMSCVVRLVTTLQAVQKNEMRWTQLILSDGNKDGPNRSTWSCCLPGICIIMRLPSVPEKSH